MSASPATPARRPRFPVAPFEERDARDACIRKFDGVWHWYYVQRCTVDGTGRSAVMLRTSRDLRAWSDGAPAYVDYKHGVKHSRLESPTVWEHQGHYWLFVRDRKLETPETPAPAIVYASDDPTHFDSTCEPTAVFPDMQAPEIVEEDGQAYVVRVSGVTHASLSGVDDRGWLEVAGLHLPATPRA